MTIRAGSCEVDTLNRLVILTLHRQATPRVDLGNASEVSCGHSKGGVFPWQ